MHFPVITHYPVMYDTVLYNNSRSANLGRRDSQKDQDSQCTCTRNVNVKYSDLTLSGSLTSCCALPVVPDAVMMKRNLVSDGGWWGTADAR